jgi:prepilin-type N-terminal cleavage/methylation domain-containing protein
MAPRCRSQAFTLVELLVSMAVLVLLVAVVVGMVSAVSHTTVGSRRRLNVDDEARRVLDLMGNDFARMFKRADADSLFVPGSTTDLAPGLNGKFFFYSDAPAYYDTTAQGTPPPNNPRATAGLIGFRINNVASSTNTSRWQLERLGKGLTWDGAAPAPIPTPVPLPGATPVSAIPGSVVFLTYPPASPSPSPASATPTPAPYPNPSPYPSSTLAGNWGGATGTTIGTVSTNPVYDDGTDTDYQVISPSVFRLEYCFLLKSTTSPYYTFSRTHDQTKGFKDVEAIVVAIALLDPAARLLLPPAAGQATPDLSKLVGLLPEPNLAGSPPQLMEELWNDEIRSGKLTNGTDASMPVSVVSQIRVYQRYFYLNTSN